VALKIQGLVPLIQVYDMPTSIRFYRERIGFEVVQTSPPLSNDKDDVHWVLLRLNDAELMLNTAYEPQDRPPTPDPSRCAAHGDSALYFGCPDVDEAYRQLRQVGLAVKEPKIAPYGMKELYVSDPDGYNLCFQWPAGA
jgi:glyoxylase I family protein